jgi:hypothetical protein
LLLTQAGRSVSLKWLTYQLLVTALRSKDRHTALYIYDQIVQRDYYFEKDPKLRLKIQLGRLIVRFPRLAMTLHGLRPGKTGLTEPQDRYERV